MAARKDFVQEFIGSAAFRRSRQGSNGRGDKKTFEKVTRRNKPTPSSQFTLSSLFTETKAVQTEEILDMQFLHDAIEKCQAKIDEVEKEKNDRKLFAQRKIPCYYVESEEHKNRKVVLSEDSDDEKWADVSVYSTDEEQDQESESNGMLPDTEARPCTSNEGMLNEEEEQYVGSIPRGSPCLPTIYEDSEEEEAEEYVDRREVLRNPKEYLKKMIQVHFVAPVPRKYVTISKGPEGSK